MRPSHRDRGGGSVHHASQVATTTAGLPAEQPPSAEDGTGFGKALSRALRHDSLRRFLEEGYSRVQDFSVNGNDMHTSQSWYEGHVAQMLDIGSAFSSDFSTMTSLVVSDALAPKLQSLSKYDQSLAKAAPRGPESLAENGSWSDNSSMQVLGAVSDRYAVQASRISSSSSSSSSDADSVFDDSSNVASRAVQPPRAAQSPQADQPSRKSCDITGSHKVGSSVGDSRKISLEVIGAKFRREVKEEIGNDNYTLELSIRRVLSARPSYADAVVAAFQRRLESIKTDDGDSSEISLLFAGVFRSLGNQAQDEATDAGNSPARKQARAKEAKAETSTTTAGLTVPTHASHVERKRGRDEDEDNDQKKSPPKKPRSVVPEKHWLCPYSVRYKTRATGACRSPTTFRSFSDLKTHLRDTHRTRPEHEGTPSHPELYMSKKQYNAIEAKAEEASKKRPRQGTKAAFEKQLGIFQVVWRILFPDCGFGLKSPYCEDLFVVEIGMLADAIFETKAQRAFERGDVSGPAEYRPNRTEFSEMMQQVHTIIANYEPETVCQLQDIFSLLHLSMLGGQRATLPDASAGDEPRSSRAVSDAQERNSPHSSERTATSSLSGGGNSPQSSSSHSSSDKTSHQAGSAAADFAVGEKIDDQGVQEGIQSARPQIPIEPAMLQNLDPRELRDEVEWPPHGVDCAHSQRELPQSMDSCHPPGPHTGTPSFDPATPHLVQESETPFLDQMIESSIPFDAGFYFDWKDGKREGSASTSADWEQLPFSQPEADVEESWQQLWT